MGYLKRQAAQQTKPEFGKICVTESSEGSRRKKEETWL